MSNYKKSYNVALHDIVNGSIVEIREILDKGMMKKFVWPDEGEFINGQFIFNDESEKLGLEPLIIDQFTASAAIQVFDALKGEIQQKVDVFIAKDRVGMARFINKVWDIAERG